MTFQGTLFDFQKEAVEMMLDRKAVLLAHGLGMGKTVSSIATIEALIDGGDIESCLVICPASIKWQWYRQIKKFTDGALVMVIEGAKPDRVAQYRAVKRGDVEYFIMNYEQVVADWDIVRLLDIDATICDEAVAIKNPGAKRSRHIKRLRTRYRYALTGQPIENRPEELFSIMQWVDPEVLGDFRIFDRAFIVRGPYGQVQNYRNLKVLRERMRSVMHRRTRKDVRDQLPAIVEKSYLVDFDQAAKHAYDVVADDLLGAIRDSPKYGSFNVLDHYSGAEENQAYGEIMTRLMALRMLCDHPNLLQISARNFDDPTTVLGSEYAARLRKSGLLEKLNKHPKMDVALDLIDEILEADHRNKIVLFSFFKPMLAMISDELKVGHGVFTGDLTPRERDRVLVRFERDSNCRVLLSSDAGGIGVDIPVANYLINYDLPWSSGKFEQRQGRILRISSKWPEVTLLSLQMHRSIEERMWEMLEQKGAIASAWLDNKGVDKKGSFAVTISTLAEFLEMTV